MVSSAKRWMLWLTSGSTFPAARERFELERWSRVDAQSTFSTDRDHRLLKKRRTHMSMAMDSAH
jgi:hypothetical protein